MAARGQQNFGRVPEITVSVAPAAPAFVMDSAVSPPTLEQHQQTLGPLRHQLTRDGAVVPDNPSGYVGQNRAQAAQQPPPYGGGSGADPSACFQYEEFAGMLGERFLSGSLSDASASASDKVYSGYSSSGEHHGQRVKLMCSFGGKILPRPGDGKLRYAGGDTRIISVYRHIKYGDFLQKMGRLYGQPVLSKYQLPNEDLDALISISSDEDVENMMEEYDRLQASEGSRRLRIFVFSLADHDLVHVNGAMDIRNTDQSYMNAINGMLETRSVSMVPLSSSNIVSGQQIPDALSASRILNNSSYAFPVVSNPQFASAIGQSVPTGMLQQQLLSKIGPAVSPSTPPSPTISSQLPHIRQAGTSNAFFPFYGDHVLKGPTTQIHEQQWIDTVYQDDVGVGSGTSSLNSQQEGHYRHFDTPRLIDSPTKAQYEAMLDHTHHQEQFLMAESMHPKMTQNSGMSYPDSYGRLPRVGSDRSLMALQQQQLDVSGPVGRLSDVLQPSVDLQNLVIHDQGCPPQSAWQHPRQEVFQRLRPVRLSAPDNIQGLAVASQQLRVSPYPSPVVIPSHEMAAYNQLDQSGGVMSGFLLQKPPAVQSSIQSPGTGQFYVQPGSNPSSPRVKFQDMNSNHSAVHPVFAGHAGFSGGFGEPLAQPQIEPALKGLKPLNTRLNPHEQLLFVDDPAARQQLLSPLSKHQETRGGSRQQEGDHIQGLYSDGLIRSRTPPYPGGSPYSEHLTAFSNQRLVQGEGQEMMQHDDSFAPYSNHQEGFDWTMKKPESEKTSMGRSDLGQVDLKGESSMLFNVSKATETSPALNTQESSFGNPSPIGATYFDSHVPLGTNFMPAAGPQTNLDGVQLSNASAYLPTPSEVPLGDSNMMGASTENQLLKSAPFPVANIAGNVNSLFEADLKEGRWVKGIPAEDRPSEKSERISVEHTLEINDSPFLDGKLGASDKDTRSPDEPFRSPDTEHSNVTVNRNNKPNDTFYNHMQLPTSLGTSNLADLGSRQNFPLSPRISAGNLPLGSPSLSRPMEASTGASCLSEVVKDYNCGDFVSFIQTNDLELPRSEFAFSNIDRPVNTQYVSLVTSSQATNSVDAKDDFPIFDSESVEASEYKDIGSNKAPASAEVDFLPSSLYSAPTLSMQNWETSLETTRVEDLVVENNRDTSDHIELRVLEREVLEAKGAKPLDDADGNNANTNPAAMAEAEAVSRGLQTIKNADLEELQELGTGTFGTVFHGKWRGTDVAIKRIKSSCFSGKPSERDRLIADFWKEAYILGQLHHPNVVAFYGVVPDGPGGTLATVTEYMVNGSLKQVLNKKDRTIDRRKRLLIIMDAAFGMEYLHGKNIVHFDLKCENLLVNMKDPHRPICKVGDLGLSKVKQQTMVSGGVRGTLPWMAPELLSGSSDLVSEKVDVYSFGIVMWELLTGEEPYAKMHYGAIIGGIVNNTLRPPIPSWCDPSWKTLMEKCWSADPQERPAFLEISAELRTMENSKSQGQISGPPN